MQKIIADSHKQITVHWKATWLIYLKSLDLNSDTEQFSDVSKLRFHSEDHQSHW